MCETSPSFCKVSTWNETLYLLRVVWFQYSFNSIRVLGTLTCTNLSTQNIWILVFRVFEIENLDRVLGICTWVLVIRIKFSKFKMGTWNSSRVPKIFEYTSFKFEHSTYSFSQLGSIIRTNSPLPSYSPDRYSVYTGVVATDTLLC